MISVCVTFEVVKPDLYPRAIEKLIKAELMPSFNAIMVVGPRGSGKSTSLGRLSDSILDLSIPGIRRAAAEDPDGLLDRETGVVFVDEWQEEPEILGAVKRAVDASPRQATKFLIAGSVRARRSAATWPGTGRFVRLRMYGLTMAERRNDDTYNPVDLLFGDASDLNSEIGLNPGHSLVTRNDYLDTIVGGRYPEVLGLVGRNRGRWFACYVERLIDRDAAQVASRPSPEKLRAVLGSCVARSGQEFNRTAAARDAGVDVRTVEGHVSLLEDLGIVVRIPAWHSKRLRRLTQAPKMHVTDTGLAAYLTNVDAIGLGRHATLVGQLFESFVAGELLSHIESAEEETFIHHLRNHDGREVDFVLERGGRLVGLEVKSSTSVGRSDAKGLAWLRDSMGADFHLGVVFYSGSLPFQLEERIWALPISTLWLGFSPANAR